MGFCWDWRECFHCLETCVFTLPLTLGQPIISQGAPELSYLGSWSIPQRHKYGLKLPLSCSSFPFSLLPWNYRLSTMLWWSVANNVILYTYNILVCACNYETECCAQMGTWSSIPWLWSCIKFVRSVTYILFQRRLGRKGHLVWIVVATKISYEAEKRAASGQAEVHLLSWNRIHTITSEETRQII